MALKVIFWGNSQSVFSSRHFGALLDVPCDLAAVVDVPPTGQDSTNPLPAGLPIFAQEASWRGVPVLSPASPYQPEFVEQMRALSPDLFLAAGYGLILKPPILAVSNLLAANFHASLLPHYRGKHPVFWTLRGGERWAGLTVHVMDPGIDTGDIIYQVKVRTRRDDTVTTLYERIMDRSLGLIGRLVADAERGTIPRRPQAAGEGFYFSSTSEEDFRLDWAWPMERIRRYIAMTPGQCYITAAGQRLYLSQAEKARDKGAGSPGALQRLGRVRCLVATGDGALWIGRARLDGGQEQPMAPLCRRLGLKVGDRLA
jgi:methionyl-tRNA formyltransferase